MMTDAPADRSGDRIEDFLSGVGATGILQDILGLCGIVQARFDARHAALAAAEEVAQAEASRIIQRANSGAFDIVSAAHRDAESIIAAAKSTAEAEAQRYQGDRAARLREIVELDATIVARRETLEQLNAEIQSLRARFGGAQ